MSRDGVGERRLRYGGELTDEVRRTVTAEGERTKRGRQIHQVKGHLQTFVNSGDSDVGSIPLLPAPDVAMAIRRQHSIHPRALLLPNHRLVGVCVCVICWCSLHILPSIFLLSPNFLPEPEYCAIEEQIAEGSLPVKPRHLSKT